jgi:hypothetical protein
VRPTRSAIRSPNTIRLVGYCDASVAKAHGDDGIVRFPKKYQRPLVRPPTREQLLKLCERHGFPIPAGRLIDPIYVYLVGKPP